MLQLQLRPVQVYIQEGALVCLDIEEQHGQQIKSSKAYIRGVAVAKEASPMVDVKVWHIMGRVCVDRR